VNGTLAVARREISEKAFVLIAACVLALVPFLVVLIPAVRQFDSRQTIATTAAFLSVGFAWGLAVILGATVVGRDLTERRLSFYFARPISSAAIWFGKMGASLVLVLISFAILFGPAIAFAFRAWRKSWDIDLRLFLGLVVVISIVLLLVAHAMSTMVRSRSPLVLVDFVMLIVVVLAAVGIALPLASASARNLVGAVMGAIGGAFILAMIGAGWYQIADGRVERRQSHRAMSFALWSSMGLVLVLAGLYVAWVQSAKPSDFVSLHELEQPANGPWIVVGGATRHRLDFRPTFLINTDDGSYQRIGGTYRLGLDSFFSSDGKTVGWITPTNFRADRFELMLQRLTPGAKPVATGIPVRPFSELAITDDGARVAIFADTMTIWDVAQRKLLGSFRLPRDRAHRWLSYFRDANHLRLIAVLADEEHTPREAVRDHTIRILEYDIARRALGVRGETHMTARNIGVSANGDGSLLILRAYDTAPGAPIVRVIDGRTGARITDIAEPSSGLGTYRILSNQMLAVARLGDPDSALRFYTLDGTLRHELPLPGVRRVTVIGEVAPGKLLIDGYRGSDSSSRRPMKFWSAMVVDSATGTIVTQTDGVWPVSGDWYSGFTRDPRRHLLGAPPLFIDESFALVSWDPQTGRRKIILPPGSARNNTD
jgi:ABC-type transport system involved in multi-copper enzyme maturation permease subunit